MGTISMKRLKNARPTNNLWGAMLVSAENYSILIIEDNPGEMRLIQEYLAKLGKQVNLESASTLAKGLEKTAGSDFDLIVLDLWLPDSTGLQTYFDIKQQSNAPAIIVLVDSGAEDFGLEAVRKGAQDFFAKGKIDPKLFCKSVEFAIQRKKLQEEVSQSEERYRTLVESSPTGILRHSSGIVDFVNEKGASILGGRIRDIVGQDVHRFVSESFFEFVSEESRAGGHAGPSQEPFKGKLLRLDGSEFFAEVSVTHVGSGNPPSFQIFFSDTSKTKEQSRVVKAIGTLAHKLRDSRRTDEVIDVVQEQLGVAFPGSSSAITVSLPGGDGQVIVSANGQWKPSKGVIIRSDEGVTSEVIVSRKPYLANEFHKEDDGIHTNVELMKLEKSIGCVPMIAAKAVIGTIWLGKQSPIAGEEFRTLGTIAGISASILGLVNVSDRLRTTNKELLNAYDETIEGWVRTLAARDIESFEHSQRVTDLSLRLAKKVGLHPEDEKTFWRGAILHDIGKMSLPDRVLLKRGQLTDQEFEQIRAHTTLARELLTPMYFLDERTIDIPTCHHENWDGSGYPSGLQGEGIPFFARVFAIADVFDALTTDRPYRDAWSKAKALRHMKEQRGKKFDPSILDVFLEMVEAGKTSELLQ